MSISFFIDNAQLGIQVLAGLKIVYIGTDNKIYTIEYNGTDWDELWLKKNDYIDDNYIKDELISPLYGKAKGVIYSKNQPITLTKIFTIAFFYKLESYKSGWIGAQNIIIDDYKIRFWTAGFVGNYETKVEILKEDKVITSIVFTKSSVVNNNNFSAITFDNGVFTIYDNNQSKKLDCSQYFTEIPQTNIVIGARYDGGNTARYITMYNIYNFNYALSSHEVKNLYNNGRSDKCILPNSYKNIDAATQQGCIGEYISSSLTKTQWRDTSGQGNHLIAEGTPELIYEEPYQEILTGEGAPSVIPDFVNQTYIDTTNKKKYCAMGTTAITDWIALN